MLVIESLPEPLPVIVIVVVGGRLNVRKFLDLGRLFRVETLEMSLSGAFPRRNKPPLMVTEDFFTKLCQRGIILL